MQPQTATDRYIQPQAATGGHRQPQAATNTYKNEKHQKLVGVKETETHQQQLEPIPAVE